MKAVICPDTRKPQEYRHIMKGPDNPKWTRTFANEIGHFSKESEISRAQTHVSLFTSMRYPKAERSHTTA